MVKNACFEKTRKIAAALGGFAPKPHLASGSWGLRSQTPELLLSSPVTVIFNANVITVKKERKKLRSCNNILLLSLISYFKLCAGYPSKHHWLRFLGM